MPRGSSGSPSSALPTARTFGVPTSRRTGLGPPSPLVLRNDVFLASLHSGTANYGGSPFSTTGAGDLDFDVVKLDSGGNHQWSNSFGDANDQVAGSIATDSAGNVYISCGYTGTIDFGGGALPTSTGNGACIAKLSPTGGHEWTRGFPHADSAGTTDPGTLVLEGTRLMVGGHVSGVTNFGTNMLSSPGNEDVLLAAFDSASGDPLWAAVFGDSAHQRARGIATRGDDPFVTGHFDGRSTSVTVRCKTWEQARTSSWESCSRVIPEGQPA